MILDSFIARTLVFQIQYSNAYILWDRAGVIGMGLSNIWPDLTLREGQPQQQIFEGKGVVVHTGIEKATITLSGPKVLEPSKVRQIAETFALWREQLEFVMLERVSTRVVYSKEFASIAEANADLFALNLAKWPDTKVFDQPMQAELNGLEIAYRFEDSSSFSVLRVKAEQIKAEIDLDNDFFEEPKRTKTKNRLVIDFDRGLLGSVGPDKFRVDDWIRGYQHILNRDIEKVLKGTR